jgi:DNA-binding MarR family transcriptional regulator
VTEPDPTPATRDTANQLRAAISAFKRRIRDAVTEGELSGPQLTALSRLDRLGPMTTAELARREQITPQAMGTTIASLERLGLVARDADAADARRSILSLTPDGLAAIRSGRNAMVDQITAALESSFAAEETAILAAAAPLIQRLADLL